ncbi:MAG: DNA polymerase III subunit beta [Bacteroidaceae bacterium]|nr:DNA polymerase III subunit beta [Bacteroidaceae bacterium]
MKFIVSSTDLAGHLQAISRVINAKNTLPILDCFLFELRDGTLYITGSDGETTMTTQVEVTESDKDGKVAVTAKTLLDALREGTDQPLTFEVNEETLEVTVSYMNGHYSLMGQNADVYPLPLNLGENTTQVVIAPNVLQKAIASTLFATADDELRPVMNGIYFDITQQDITFVASDGHKLVRYRTQAACGNNEAAFILPKKPAVLLKNLLTKEEGEVKVVFNDRNAMISVGDHRLICRLIDGRYPNYNSVIPQNNPYLLTLDRQSILSAIRRVSIFSSQASSLVKLSISENKLILSAQDIDFSTSAQEVVDCQYVGANMNIGFKGTFLLEIFSNISSTEVTFALADPSRAGVVEPVDQEEGDSLLMLLMPMMLND